MTNDIIKDGGAKSRKLWFSVFAITVIAGTGVFACYRAGMIGVYPTLVGGVLGVVGAYLTGNVAQKWVGSKAPMDGDKPQGIHPLERSSPMLHEDHDAQP